MSNTAQQEFDQKYISSREILTRLAVTRPTISLAVRRNLLPAPVKISSNAFVWLRAEVEPIIKAWKARRAA